MGIGALRGKANYRRPAYLLILMDILGFCLLYASNDYNINIIYTGVGHTGAIQHYVYYFGAP